MPIESPSLFAQLQDEVLVVIAKECEAPALVLARDELILRYRTEVCDLVDLCLLQAQLSAFDQDDARQNAVLLVLTAIGGYDFLQRAEPAGCSFRSFLHQVITKRSHNLLRDLRRHATTGELPELDLADRTGVLGCGTAAAVEDPAIVAERNELIALVRVVAQLLDDDARQVWQLLEAGVRRSQLGDALGISYDAGRRRYHRCIGQFARHFQHLKTA